MRRAAILAILAGATLAAPRTAHAIQGEYYAIRVVDEGGAGVPCVVLRTTNAIALRTDSQGRAAFYEPGLMDTQVWFSVEGEHVTRTPDMFGFVGAALTPTQGGSGDIEVMVTGTPTCEANDLESQRIDRGVPSPEEYFRVDVRDAETDRAVPLVVVEIGDARWISDSSGHIAIDPLGFSGDTAANVWSHGYAFDSGIVLSVEAGATAEIAATRMLPAERLYRVTGGGIHRDSVLLGLEAPIAAPTINGLVVGQDSVFTAVHRDRVRWIWGDTTRPAYPLGNFHASGATTATTVDIENGIDLEYFVDDTGFSRAMAPTETVPGEGVTWLGGLVSVPGADGQMHLHATFAMVLSDFSKTRFGMLAYDDTNERFVDGVDFDLGANEHRYPHENAFLVRHGDREWVYYHAPVRIPATSEALLDPTSYETFTPYLDVAGTQIDRDEYAIARYEWRGGGIPYPSHDEALAPVDTLDAGFTDVITGEVFEAHGNGSTEHNDYTGRWLRLVTPAWALGETWLALSDTPMGPWVYATQLVTHEQYTFYNPRHHRMFDTDFGRRIHFEATYTNTFSGNPDRTDRYDYNQVMYGVDLDRPELAVPVPIYRSIRGELGAARVILPDDPSIAASFFAPVRPAAGTVAVAWSGPRCESPSLVVGDDPPTTPIFYALPPDATPSDMHVALREKSDGTHGVGDDGETIAYVWRNPIGVRLPVADYLPELRADAGIDQCVGEDEVLELPPRDDVPEGGSARWELDGVVIEDPADAQPGLHMLARVLVRADGFEVRDEAIVRIQGDTSDTSGTITSATTTDADEESSGDADADDGGGGCGCATTRTSPLFGLGLLALARRRRR